MGNIMIGVIALGVLGCIWYGLGCLMNYLDTNGTMVDSKGNKLEHDDHLIMGFMGSIALLVILAILWVFGFGVKLLFY